MPLLVLCLALSEGKKKKKENLFTSENLKCLVCKAVVEEVSAAINKVDPKKKIETGTFRLSPDGSQEKTVVSAYA